MTVKYIPLESKSGFKSPGFLVSPDGSVSGKKLTLAEDLDVQNITLSGVELLSGADSTISLGDGIKHSYLEKLGTLQYLNIDGDFTVSQASTPYISVINGEIRITNPQYLTSQVYENITQLLSGTVNNTGGSEATFKVTRSLGTYSISIVNRGKNFAVADYIIIPGTFLGGETPANNLRINIVSVLPSPLDFSAINEVSIVGTAVNAASGSLNNITVGLTTPVKGKFTDVELTNNLTVDNNVSIDGDVTVIGTGQFDSVRVETTPTEAYHVTRKDYVDNRISAFSIALGG
jgi:hypothetical protein